MTRFVFGLGVCDPAGVGEYRLQPVRTILSAVLALTVLAFCSHLSLAEREELLGGEIYLEARRSMADSRWDDALKDFNTLVTVSSPLADYARYWQGVCCMELGRRSSAVDAFLSVSEEFPDSPVRAHARLALGDIYSLTGARDHAVKMYRAALSQVPNSIDSTYGRLRLAEVLIDMGDTEKAYDELRLIGSPGRQPPDYFDRATGLMQKSAVPADLLQAAQWCYDAGDYADASILCRRVRQSADVPLDVRRRATLLLGRSLARDGRLEEAVSVCHDAAIEYTGSVAASQAMLTEAITLRKMRQTTQFVALIEKLAEMYPHSQAAETGVLTVAKAYDGWGRYENAQVWYGRFADCFNWSWAVSETLYRRGVLASLDSADPDSAIELFRDVLDRSKSTEYRAAAHYWIGKLQLARGNTHSSAAAMSAAARLKPFSYYGMRARGALTGLFDSGPAVPARALQLSQQFILFAPQPTVIAQRGVRSDSEAFRPPTCVGSVPTDQHTQNRLAVARLLVRAGLDEADWELEALNARFGRPETKWGLAWVLYDAGAYGRAMRIAETLEARRGAVEDQMKLVYPLAFHSEARHAAERFGVDVLLVEAIMREESRFKTEDISGAGAVGLMQLMPETARWAAEQMSLEQPSAGDIHDPAVNVALGTWYVRHLLDRFNGNIVYSVAAYNAGPGNVDRWIGANSESTDDIDMFIEGIPYEETRGYVKRVLRSYAAYKMLYG